MFGSFVEQRATEALEVADHVCGWAISHDKNDLWIAAATRVAGVTLLSTDTSAFQPLRDGNHLSVVLLDPKTGLRPP